MHLWKRKSMCFGAEMHLGQELPFPSWVSLHKLLNLAEVSFLYLQCRDDKNSFLRGLLGVLKGTRKWIVQHLACNKGSFSVSFFFFFNYPAPLAILLLPNYILLNLYRVNQGNKKKLKNGNKYYYSYTRKCESRSRHIRFPFSLWQRTFQHMLCRQWKAHYSFLLWFAPFPFRNLIKGESASCLI